MSETPFTTHGDEALEARIVSWVLGEASSFEAAELARLCEERPELLVFKRRMLALHGLLAEAESQEQDAAWKLPADKRRVIEELFGAAEDVHVSDQRDTRVHHAGRRALFAIAACILLAVVVFKLMPGEMAQKSGNVVSELRAPLGRNEIAVAPAESVVLSELSVASERGAASGGGGAAASFAAASDEERVSDALSSMPMPEQQRMDAPAPGFLEADRGNVAIKPVLALKKESRQVPAESELREQKAKRDSTIAGESSQLRTRQLSQSAGISDKPVIEETHAAEEPYSTFSLNISDASFQIAQAALAKGERPDPAAVKVEQFYNAVDYGDPAPSNGEPVAVAIEQAAHPVIPGRNLVRVALKTAAEGRSAAQPLRLTLLVDQSGSMSREDRRFAMDKALNSLSRLLTADDLVNVIGFSRTPKLLADAMVGDQAQSLSAMSNQAASEGGTNLDQAIQLASQLAERRKKVGAQNRIVLFTDGAANLGDADPARLAEQVKELRQKGIAFDIAGIAADGLNDELLGELARNGNGRYYVVGKGGDDAEFAKQLAGAFRPAAENVKVQVRFNAERVARYKLIGFEKDRLQTEDFRNDAVDAAELAAEEAGVAIYQVELLLEGKGEIGEVSVRFRDTAADQMVERIWTVPHDVAAPAIDRASPSMQLATLAMLAGEKLKGGALAGAIDFNDFAAASANVKQFYGSNPRVTEVLRMVDALK